MNKLLVAVSLVIAFGMTSCKKDYTCDCKDSTNGTQITTNQLPNTRLVDARKACKDRQSVLQNGAYPAASCTIL